jgi:hypothetical protein
MTDGIHDLAVPLAREPVGQRAKDLGAVVEGTGPQGVDVVGL